MPFFYAPGNHDVANAFQESYWKEKFGRRYYHFVYRDVLFLVLNSDDPPSTPDDPDYKATGGTRISSQQIDYVRKALEENRNTRWTFVALHKPMWNTEHGCSRRSKS